jgi:AAA family ATP:ADP antiporter
VKRFGQALKVRTGEGRVAALGIALMLVVAAGAAFGQSGIDALYFARSGVGKLPLLLILSGGSMFVASVAVTALMGRVARQRLFLTMPLVIAAVLMGERGLVAASLPWIYPTMWLTAGLAQMMQALFTWGMFGLVVDTRQAKRLFPLFAAGWILGSVIGGLLTHPLADRVGAQNLLIVWAAGLVAAFALGRLLLGRSRRADMVHRRSRHRTTRPLQEIRLGLRYVRGTSLLRWLALAAMLFSVAFYLLYLPFSRAATERFPDANALAGFFGLFWAATAAVAFLMSLFLTGRLFARFGVMTMTLVLPLIYLIGFGTLIVQASLVTLVAVRFVQLPWLQSVANPAWESVINVVPPARRDQTRAFLNGGPAQAGTIIAGLIELIGAHSLSARQLFAVGLGASAITIFACWRARDSYAAALVDALRTGRPQVFPTLADDESVFGRQVDAAAVTAAVDGVSDPDVRVRRAAVEILGDIPGREDVPDALQAALGDVDTTVRATALRSLSRAGYRTGLPGAIQALTDPEAEVRLAATRAVDSLGDASAASTEAIRPLLEDQDPAVRSATASTILRRSADEEASAVVRSLLGAQDSVARVSALEAIEGSASSEVFGLIANRLDDPIPAVRAAAARTLAASDQSRAIAPLVRALGDEDQGVREAASGALGAMGSSAVEPVVAALSDPTLAEGALLSLGYLPADRTLSQVRTYAHEETARAVADFDVSRAIEPGDDDRARLLRDSLVDRAHHRAINALRAAALVGDRTSSGTAIDNISSRDPVQVANALEALESLGESSIVRPLLGLWEPAVPRHSPREVWLPLLLTDPDPWIRDCAALLDGAPSEGVPMAGALSTLSDMERVLFLRKVPLFAELVPQDLKRIATVCEEQTYVDGEVIEGQGETGDELHIVVEGEVRVLRAEPVPGAEETELAKRGAGDVVGEMSLITQEPRMASVLASGDVRTLRLGRKEFEGVLRERPDTAIAVIRVLSQRLLESAHTQRI